MNRFIAIGILTLLSLISFGQEVKHYDFNVDINVKDKLVEVDGFIEVDFQNKDSIELILWKKTIIKSIQSENKEMVYTFNTESKSPSQYIPKGSSLIITNHGNEKGYSKIYFSYQCNMTEMNIWGNQFNEDWVELGIYSAWYPVNLKSQNFTSSLKVTADENYIINGSGLVTENLGKYTILHYWNIFDNVIIASKDLKQRSFSNENSTVDLLYSDFPESDIDSLFYIISDVIYFYTKLFGTNAKDNYLKFVLVPGSKGGYSRAKYISYAANKYNEKLLGGIVHETAHFWWSKANTSSWEDWLNESFASYSYLIYVRERVGIEKYNEIVESYREKTKYTPPIWGLDRNSKEAYNTLYRKGALILIDFEKKVGPVVFQNLLRKITLNEIKTTVNLLDLIESELSVSDRNWLESMLKK